jgi:hypothetical protein
MSPTVAAFGNVSVLHTGAVATSANFDSVVAADAYRISPTA